MDCEQYLVRKPYSKEYIFNTLKDRKDKTLTGIVKVDLHSIIEADKDSFSSILENKLSSVRLPKIKTSFGIVDVNTGEQSTYFEVEIEIDFERFVLENGLNKEEQDASNEI